MILPYPLLPYLLFLPFVSSLDAQNGSSVELLCRAAEVFIRTHMAPDFVSPQLVRRLDWFHEDALIASFEQGLVEDSSRQWWVAEQALTIGVPFYSLKIKPLRPEHSGTYKCRLETDPLFSLDLSTSTLDLAVLVVPVAPSQPEIRAVSNVSVTLSWTHPTAKAHRPILRYSVLVRSVSDSSRFVIPAQSNATSVIVDNLSPHTTYAFSVRAENVAGLSSFGPEKEVTTKGQAPTTPPDILRIESSSSCIRLLLSPPLLLHGKLLSYRVTLSPLNETEILTRNFTSQSPESEWLEVCELQSFSSYSVAVEASNLHGFSPPARILVQTDQGAPDAPSPPRLRPTVGTASVTVHWRAPNITRGVLVHYTIHYRLVEGGGKWTSVTIPLQAKTASSPAHKTEVKALKPGSAYSFRVTAATVKGEGRPSAESTVETDVEAPNATEIGNVSIECEHASLRLGWKKEKKEFVYSLTLANSTGKWSYNTTEDFLSIGGLSYHEKYTMYLTTLIASRINSTILLASPPSIHHHFLLKDGCLLLSSLCSTSNHCLPLLSSSQNGRFVLLVSLILILLFLLVSSLVTYLIRQKCFDLKRMLKKKEKSVLIDELCPLVYDAEGMEDVPVELFYGMCEDLAKNDNFKYRQLFERINELTETEGETPSEGDSTRDRYANVVATEISRVRIRESDDGSDYINANFVDSCETPHAYIAAQAPLPSTFGHFWSMVWQERVNVIVMITNLVEDGKRKSDPYWPPSSTAPQFHGKYQVSLVSQSTTAHFVHRILSLRIAKSLPPTERRVHHVHFTSWPDHSVPSSVFPLLSFLHFVADIHSTGPVLVHCSAGVGRSGSFILIDSMRRRLLSHRSLNLSGHLVHIRRQREKVVQTLEQFIFCHEVVRQLARHGITRVPVLVFPRYVHFLVDETSFNGRLRIHSQFDDLCKCPHATHCSPYSSKPVVLPGFHRINEFVVAFHRRECTQLWRTAWEYGCESIVVIHKESEEAFWSRTEDEFDGITVVHEDERRVRLSNQDEELLITLLHLHVTSMDADTWASLERIHSERLSTHASPLLVVSTSSSESSPVPPPSLISNGTLTRIRESSLSLCRPYLFCALSSLACQLEQQSAIDVVQTIDAFHSAKCGVFPDRMALEYLYERLLLLVKLNKS